MNIEIVNLCQSETPENDIHFAHDIKSMEDNPGQVVAIQNSTMRQIIEALPPVYYEGMIGMGEVHDLVLDLDGTFKNSFFWTFQPKLDTFEKLQAGLLRLPPVPKGSVDMRG